MECEETLGSLRYGRSQTNFMLCPMAEKLMSDRSRPSKILLDELYAAEDDDFIECLKQFDSYEYLKHFSQRWAADKRPWARSQLVRYFHSTLNDPGHEVVIKRTFKAAIEREDDELLSHFLVAFDGLVRRIRSQTYSYNYRTRESYSTESLFAKPNKTVREESGRFIEYKRFRKTYRMPLPDIRNRSNNRLFSQRTRSHLRRRVWRYFRVLAYQNPQRYVAAMTQAFALYTDAHFDCGEGILDNWSLMHAAYHHSPVIAFTASHTNVVQGQSMTALTAAPYLPRVWEGDRSADRLWKLLVDAQSQLVRIWTIEMLQSLHSDWLRARTIDQLMPLLSSSEPSVGEFAVELFRNHGDLANLEISAWLRLIETSEFSILPTLCEAMREHVSSERLSDDQLVELTVARVATVAKLGLQWLKQRHQQRSLSTDHFVRLAQCRCDSESETIANWAISELAVPDRYSKDHLICFFDSAAAPIRRAACDWLVSSGDESIDARSAHRFDPGLWRMLSESPYDEVRFALVSVLGNVLDHASNEHFESLSVDAQCRVYSATILAVHRGSRSKPKAIKQLALLVESQPERCGEIIPILAISARSIRSPEQSAALSSIATLLERCPQLAIDVKQCLPEWEWGESELEDAR